MGEVLRGSLSAVTLPSVLQLVESEVLTGWLRVEGVGRVGFHQGRPVQAHYRDVQGVGALLELFIAGGAQFRFEAADTVEGRPLGSLLGLIMEGCRLDDEWQRIREVHLCRTDATPQVGGAVDRVTPQLTGTVTLERAVEHAGVTRASVVEGLQSLLDAGALREATADEVKAHQFSTETLDYYTALEVGRTAMRAGEWDDAEAAFHVALELRPNDRVAAQNLRRLTKVREQGGVTPTPWFRKESR